MVLRALIVEDERVTRETLRTMVPWSRLGVEEVDTARDGVEALEKAERRMPDLVVSDIRMPRLGGIELAQKLREKNPECGIIFLSGHSDKAYLKAAIRLHAADYIDKPLNLEEIGAAVERNVRALRARAGQSAEAERARRVLTDLEPVLRAELAEALCRPGADVPGLKQRCAARVSVPFLDGPVRVALVEVEVGGGEPPTEVKLRELARTLNEAAAPGASAAWPAGPARLGLLVAGEEVGSDGRFEAALAGVARAVERALPEARLRFGVGPPAPSPQGAPPSLAGAAAALGMRFYEPSQAFLRPPSPAAAASVAAPDRELDPRLRGALDAGDLEAAVAVLRDLEARARSDGAPAEVVREAYGRLLRRAIEQAPGWDPPEMRAEQDRTHQAVRAQPTLAGLAALAEATLRRCYAPSGAGAERRIARIKEFIRAHHADPDLLVETVAAGVGLSESYLCTVFKQACGTTVKDHLTQVRIDRAKQLLRETGEKLQAVALRVGYRDANYFSTVFKREVGITPSEYRERALR